MAGRFRVLALIAVIVLVHGPDLAAALPKPIHTSKSRFRIPFKFDSPAMERIDAREVQLHVSRDQGANWELAQSLTPDRAKFEYQTSAEGEYWFSVKTLDGRNQLHPARGTYETGLIVVIDHTSPVLELSLKQSATGRAQLTWLATDSNLDINSLSIEYLSGDVKDWTPLPVNPQRAGEHSWSVGSSGMIKVRGSISDLAGNVGESNAHLRLTSSDEPAPKPRPTRRGPIAETPADEGALSSKSDASAVPLPNDVAQKSYDGPVITPQGGLPHYQRVRDPGSDQWTGNGVIADPVSARTQFLQGGQPTSQLVSKQIPAAEANAPRRPSRQKIVSTNRFQIGYELDVVGPSGIGEVELFITEDNGRKWWKYGNDADQKSPFDVEVPRDGVYGFAIRVSNGAGLSGEPPVPGEQPAIVVAVDQTPPTVELLPIQQGRGNNSNRLLIRWKITEDNSTVKPVSLYYSATLNGPWEPITGWREELNGGFEWVAGPAVPNQFYIRVMARDAAGNVGKAETQTPIVVDMVRPSARIVDVEATAVPQPR